MAKKKMPKKKVAKKKKAARELSVRQEDKRAEAAFEIRASGDKFLGSYSNVAIIKHTPREFVLDFLLRIDNYNTLAARVITSSQHAKEIHRVLGENITQYEKQYGEIKLKKTNRQ